MSRGALRRATSQLNDLLFSGNRATIDAIRTAPAPSPLAPVDLSDRNRIQAVLDLAARIGDLLLAAGTGNSDTQAHIKGIASAYGLHYIHVSITLNTIHVYANYSADEPPAHVFRVVRKLSTDYSNLTEVDRLVRSIMAGATSLETAQQILFEIEVSPPPYRSRYALASWGFFAGSVALMLGGGWVVALMATITTTFTVFATAWLASKSLPLFYQNVIGGFIAVIPAALTYNLADRLGLWLPPSLIIASCIVAMLAGLTLVQALIDGVTGAPVTASARFFETLLQTGAIIGGIGFGIVFVNWVGLTLPGLNTATTTGSFLTVPIQIIGGTAATVFFCAACFCERRAMVVAGGTALSASSIYFFLISVSDGAPLFSAAAAALWVGFVGGLLSRRYLIPPQITSAAGITPLLPGLALYRGMNSVLNDEFIVGISNLALALATATVLAASVVLGEWTARRIRRPRIINRYQQVLRPRVRRRNKADQPRLTTDGRVRQPLHWRFRRNRPTTSIWQLESGEKSSQEHDE